MIWYKAEYYGSTPTIEKVFVDRVTQSSVWIGKERKSRISDHVFYSKSERLARGWVLVKMKDRVEVSKRKIELEKKHMQDLKAQLSEWKSSCKNMK